MSATLSRPHPAPTAITEAAPAKINLHLHVTGRRADGYHLLDSLVVFADVADEVRVSPGDGLAFDIEGPFAAGLRDGADDNLVRRAAAALAARCGIPPAARILLVKNLPVASGIGGGSADAAATLRALGRLWGAADEAGDPALALGLGADVPVCLARRPALMQGIGERLAPAPALPRFFLALGNPGVAVPTAEIFRETARSGRPFSPPASLPPDPADAAALAGALRGLGNDLEPAAIRLAPVIADVIGTLAASPGCLLARMSGSGATCFGLFAAADAAAAAAARLARVGWWSWSGPEFACGTKAATG